MLQVAQDFSQLLLKMTNYTLQEVNKLQENLSQFLISQVHLNLEIQLAKQYFNGKILISKIQITKKLLKKNMILLYQPLVIISKQTSKII